MEKNQNLKQEQTYINKLHESYIEALKSFNLSTCITNEQFYTIFDTIYSTLSTFGMNNNKILQLSEMYLYNIIADYINGDIDIKWFIDKLWYLAISGEKEEKRICGNTIPYMQKYLIQTFNISENIFQKVERKVYTKSMLVLVRR